MQVYDFMMLFIDERMIEILGNWYPRVMAVMSCVIPFTTLLAIIAFCGVCVCACWRMFK